MARLASFTCTVDFAQPHATGIAFQIQKNRICPCVESIPCLELFECQFNKGKSSLRVHCSVFLPGGVFMQKNCKRRTGVIVSRRVQKSSVHVSYLSSAAAILSMHSAVNCCTTPLPSWWWQCFSSSLESARLQVLFHHFYAGLLQSEHIMDFGPTTHSEQTRCPVLAAACSHGSSCNKGECRHCKLAT